MAIQPIKRQNVSELVFDQMQEMIINGEWEPGSKISSENELASQMGVSRVTIRSAIQKLSSLGLVESRHGEGTYVCKLDGSQYFNSMLPMIALSTVNREALYELRDILESACAALAARRITPEQLAELRRVNDDMAANVNAPDEAANADLAFHKGIASATGNPYIIQVYEILEKVFIKSLMENTHHMGASSGVRFHGRICDALEKHDAALAQELMQEHLQVTHETMNELLEKNN